jgi:hypothetical protein
MVILVLAVMAVRLLRITIEMSCGLHWDYRAPDNLSDGPDSNETIDTNLTLPPV